MIDFKWGNIMKKYKFVTIISCFLALGLFMLINYIDLPAPNKLETKLLDVNDNAVK